MIEIWHNNRCSKSRAAFNYLEDNSIEYSVRDYLKELPTKVELEEVLIKLGKNPSEIIRKKETIFKELGLKDASENELLEAMVANPKLIERPIVVNGNRAVIARPLEEIEKVL